MSASAGSACHSGPSEQPPRHGAEATCTHFIHTRKPEHSHAPHATSTQRVRGALLLSHLAQSVSRFCTAHTQFLPFNCPLPFALCPLPSATSLMLCTLPACALFPPPFTCRPPAADCWPLAYAPWALPVGLCLPPACRLLPIATCPLASGRCPPASLSMLASRVCLLASAPWPLPATPRPLPGPWHLHLCPPTLLPLLAN